MNTQTEASKKPIPHNTILVDEDILRWHIRFAVFAGFVAGYIFKAFI